MKKILTITAVLLITALIAVPAFAAVQNVRVSGSVDSKYLYRKNFDLGEIGRTAGDDEQSLFITWAILQVDADLTDQVSATIALINERPWEQDPTDSDYQEVDILLAYVTLREMLYSPLTLIVGRQAFAFGNSFIIDSAGTNNDAPSTSGIDDVAEDLTKQTTMDAIRAILDYNPLTLDIIYMQVEEGAAGANSDDDDVFIAGINANYLLGDDMDSVVEAYFWKKVDKSVKTASGAKADEVYTVGGRISTNPLEGWNTQVEVAYQKGNDHLGTDDNRRRSAWGIQAIANWQIPAWDEYNPTAQYVFTKVTGDGDEGDGIDDSTAWDPMLENQGGGTIYNTLFDLTNLEIHSLSFGMNPMEDLLAKLTIHGIWLERDLNNDLSTFTIHNPDDTDITKDIKPTNTHLGKEVDFELIYDYTEDVQIHTSLGWFFPGSFFLSPDGDGDHTAKQVLVNLNVAF